MLKQRVIWQNRGRSLTLKFFFGLICSWQKCCVEKRSPQIYVLVLIKGRARGDWSTRIHSIGGPVFWLASRAPQNLMELNIIRMFSITHLRTRTTSGRPEILAV